MSLTAAGGAALVGGISALGSLGAAGISAGASQYGATTDHEFIMKMRKQDWKRQDTAYQRQVDDMIKAGLNPAQAAGGGMSPVSTDATTSSSATGRDYAGAAQYMGGAIGGTLDAIKGLQDVRRNNVETDIAKENLASIQWDNAFKPQSYMSEQEFIKSRTNAANEQAQDYKNKAPTYAAQSTAAYANAVNQLTEAKGNAHDNTFFHKLGLPSNWHFGPFTGKFTGTYGAAATGSDPVLQSQNQRIDRYIDSILGRFGEEIKPTSPKKKPQSDEANPRSAETERAAAEIQNSNPFYLETQGR